jgi:hypothetical protein
VRENWERYGLGKVRDKKGYKILSNILKDWEGHERLSR